MRPLTSLCAVLGTAVVIALTLVDSRAARRAQLSRIQPAPNAPPKVAAAVGEDQNPNATRPRGVFLFDNNCLWYLHGKGQLIAKINCVTPKKRPPVIVARRHNGQMRFKLHHLPEGSKRHRVGRFGDKKGGTRRRGAKSGQIPLKCYYRYDDKGVFYLTTCYTHSRRFGPVEMNFRGHRPGEKQRSGRKSGKERMWPQADPSLSRAWPPHRRMGRRMRRMGRRLRRKLRKKWRRGANSHRRLLKRLNRFRSSVLKRTGGAAKKRGKGAHKSKQLKVKTKKQHKKQHKHKKHHKDKKNQKNKPRDRVRSQ